MTTKREAMWTWFNKHFSKWLNFKKANTTLQASGICGIDFRPDGIAISYVEPQSGKAPVLFLCEYSSKSTFADLKKLVAQYNLQGTDCAWVLQHSEYRLLQIDPLPVKPEELAGALRWRIKGLIDYPAEEAAIEYFNLPSTETEKEKLYVAVTRQNELKKNIELINASGLNLKFIGIRELALASLLSLYARDSTESLAILVIDYDGSDLVAIRNNKFQFGRHIDIKDRGFIIEKDANSEASQQHLIDFTLEIQRSLEFYQHHLHQPLPQKLIVNVTNPLIIDYFKDQLGIEIEILDLPKVVEVSDNYSSNCLATNVVSIGEALSMRDVHANN